MNEHDVLVERAVRDHRTVLLIGGLDSGKSTLAKTMLRAALEAGRTAAFLDGDAGQKSVGPPATVGLKHVRTPEDLEPEPLAKADALGFVGSTSPQGHLLPLVTSLARLHVRAREEGADFVVVDTSGLVSGIYGQLVKYHKVELLQPDLVVGLQRGEELDPLLGVIQRFFDTEVVPLGVHPAVSPASVEQRAAHREVAMRRYLGEHLQRFRIKPTVFVPTIPPFYDLQMLDRMLVGLSDGQGGFIGLGLLGYVPEDAGLRLTTPVAVPPKALRLGSVRLEDTYRAKRVDLRNLFGTE